MIGDSKDQVESQPADDAPRREASATFSVSEPVAAEAAIRQAMDPANQSLGEALRLSYRLLQLAIFGLLVTFLFSGFQTVREGFSGVKTIFGRVAGEPGMEAIGPGLNPFWPYPVGEITVFETRRTVELRNEFWPKADVKSHTIEQQIEMADSTRPIRPGTDGSVLTSEGDLGHLQLTAEYVVEDPVRFLAAVNLEEADRLVRFALQRGVVTAVAKMDLSELTGQREQPAHEVQAGAQSVLDSMSSGIVLQRVNMPERSAPFAVRNLIGQVQKAREDAKTAADRASQDATGMLLGAAGPHYADVLKLIDGYEASLAGADRAESDRLLRAVGERLAAKDIGGTASNIIQHASAYQSAIASSLGSEVRRIEGLRETFRQNPKQLARQMWLDALRSVLSQPEVEVFNLPPETGMSQLSVASSPEVMQIRRQADVDRRKQARSMEDAMRPTWNLGVRQIMINQAGRRLNAEGEKGFGRENK